VPENENIIIKTTYITKRDVGTLVAYHWVFLSYTPHPHTLLLKIIFPFYYVLVKSCNHISYHKHISYITITQHSIAMAQTMLLMSSVSSTYSVELKKDPLLQLQCQRLRSRISNVSFNPLSSNSKCLSSRTFTTLALFKSKTKAPAKVVYIYSFSIFIFLISNKQFLYNLKLIWLIWWDIFRL
jgi:hypothetical protein